MSAQVISMQSVPRSSLPSASSESFMKGFGDAVRRIRHLSYSTAQEGRMALENWRAAEDLPEEAYRLLLHHFGWER